MFQSGNRRLLIYILNVTRHCSFSFYSISFIEGIYSSLRDLNTLALYFIQIYMFLLLFYSVNAQFMVNEQLNIYMNIPMYITNIYITNICMYITITVIRYLCPTFLLCNKEGRQTYRTVISSNKIQFTARIC